MSREDQRHWIEYLSPIYCPMPSEREDDGAAKDDAPLATGDAIDAALTEQERSPE